MKQPMQVLTSMNSVEWYTPPWVLDNIVRPVMGEISLDPCSPHTPPPWIQASQIFTEEDDGLVQPWHGNVFVNPPFTSSPAWVRKAQEEFLLGHSHEVMLLVNSAPGYVWFEAAWRRWPVLMFKERIKFFQKNEHFYHEAAAQAKKGQAIIFFCADRQRGQQRLKLAAGRYGVVTLFE